MATTHNGRLIVSFEDFLGSIGYDTAFIPFTCGGSAYTGSTPDSVHDWKYGGGFIVKRGPNSISSLWVGNGAHAIGYGAPEDITWHVYE